MLAVKHVGVIACVVMVISRVLAEAICNDDFYGVLEGTPYRLPEHILMPRPSDWTISIPPICPGEYIAGMEARVCTFVPTPIIIIIDWSAAVVHMNTNRPVYSSVNVTVYCTTKSIVQTETPETTTVAEEVTEENKSPEPSEDKADHLKTKPQRKYWKPPANRTRITDFDGGTVINRKS